MIQEKLATIQRELKAPKGQFNAFGKYKYRSCEDILEAVKPLLGDAILTLSDDLVMIGERYYVRATATLREGDESISVTAWAREETDKKGMDSAQITGSVSSYARKYAANGLFLIDDTKDPDNDDNTGKGEKKPPKAPKQEGPPSAPQGEKLSTASSLHKLIEVKISESGMNRDRFKEWLFSLNMIQLKDDKPSMSTITEKHAKYLVDKWSDAVTKFNTWNQTE
jgi:hypothetical protein